MFFKQAFRRIKIKFIEKFFNHVEVTDYEKEKYVQDAKIGLESLKQLLTLLERDLNEEDLSGKGCAVWIISRIGSAGREAIEELEAIKRN